MSEMDGLKRRDGPFRIRDSGTKKTVPFRFSSFQLNYTPE